MTEITSPPPDGKFLVTIRIERSDGQFVSSSRLIPGDLLKGDSNDTRLWYLATAEMGAKFVSAYERAADLPD